MFSVLEALEREHGKALAEHRAVRLVGEWPTVATGRESSDLSEAHEHQNVVESVDPTSDHHVGLAQVKLIETGFQSGQRTRARRIDHAVGAAEVEAVGDAAGNDVAQQSGEGVLLPRGVGRGHAVTEGGDLSVGQSSSPQATLPYWALQAAGHVVGHLGATGGTEDYAHAFAVDPGDVATGSIFQHLLSHHETEQLSTVSSGYDVRRNSEIHRREVDGGQEATTFGVDLVGLVPGAGLWVVVVLNAPVSFRHLREEVGPVDNVSPESLCFRRARKQSAHADNSDIRLLERVGSHRISFTQRGRSRPSARPGIGGAPAPRRCGPKRP